MQIEFRPWLPASNGKLIQPKPAIASLPEWYKAKKPFINGEKKHRAYPDGSKNVTVKWCNPFGDALGAGYFIYLENEVAVTIDEDNQNLTWQNGGDDFISTHSIQQISEDLFTDSFSHQAWKFKNYWGIKTPKNYSVLITHPLNRTDLPFLTLSGVVDTDNYNQPINFPFLMKKGFEGFIEAGTPIAQVIPFRRENWQSQITDFDAEKCIEIEAPFRRRIFRQYKTLFWQKKEWR